MEVSTWSIFAPKKAVEKVSYVIVVRGNPFLTETTDTLHNITYRQLALLDVSKRLLSFFEHVQERFIEFREQQFVTKSIQLNGTIKISLYQSWKFCLRKAKVLVLS